MNYHRFHGLRANQRVWDLMTFAKTGGKYRPEELERKSVRFSLVRPQGQQATTHKPRYMPIGPIQFSQAERVRDVLSAPSQLLKVRYPNFQAPYDQSIVFPRFPFWFICLLLIPQQVPPHPTTTYPALPITPENRKTKDERPRNRNQKIFSSTLLINHVSRIYFRRGCEAQLQEGCLPGHPR